MDADLGRWRTNGLRVVTSLRTVRCLASSLFIVFSLLLERLTVTHTTTAYSNTADLSTFIILSAVVGYKVNPTSTSHVMYISSFLLAPTFKNEPIHLFVCCGSQPQRVARATSRPKLYPDFYVIRRKKIIYI